MSLDIEFSGIARTQAIVDYATRRLSRLNRHASVSLAIRLKLSVEHSTQQASATVASEGRGFPGLPFHAEALDVDLYAAIDKLSDKLDKLLRRAADRRRARRRDTVSEAALA